MGNVQEKYVEDFVVGVNGNDLVRKVKATTYKKYANNKTPVKGELFKFKVEVTLYLTIK